MTTGTEALIKRNNRRNLLLFTDVLLVAESNNPPGKKSKAREKIVVKQVGKACGHSNASAPNSITHMLSLSIHPSLF